MELSLSRYGPGCFLLSKARLRSWFFTTRKGRKIMKRDPLWGDQNWCNMWLVRLYTFVGFQQGSLYPSLPNTMWVGVWTPKHLLRRALGVPNTSKVFEGIWKTRDITDFWGNHLIEIYGNFQGFSLVGMHCLGWDFHDDPWDDEKSPSTIGFFHPIEDVPEKKAGL